MNRTIYFRTIAARMESTLAARNEAAQAYWHGRGTHRALRRAQMDHRAACNRWNMAVRADMRRRVRGRVRHDVAPTYRPLP